MAVKTHPRPCPAGSPSAAELVERYFMDVYALCFRILGHPQDAEDATQEAFLALFRHREKLAGTESVKAWVTAVARNTAVSLYRSRRRRGPLAEDVLEAPPLEDPVDRHRLNEAIAGLSEDERRLIEMRFMSRKSADEMAEASGKSRGAVATALCRALRRLRALYHRGTK
jgi:RNA polymerase sigma-70 factor (ECF subfamily)